MWVGEREGGGVGRERGRGGREGVEDERETLSGFLEFLNHIKGAAGTG